MARKSVKIEEFSLSDDNAMLDDVMQAREAEVKNLYELGEQRGTPIPALFNLFYKFIQNPSTVSVETYKRMVDTDDTVGSGVDFLTTCLAARMGRYEHPSEEITKWVNDSVEQIEGGWFNSVKELLSATWAGFAVQEQVWANTENGYIPAALPTLPPSTILFETDRNGKLTRDGILQYQRNWNPLGMSYGIGFFSGILGGSTSGFNDMARPDAFAKLGDLPFPVRTGNIYSYMTVRIPTMKCVHYAFDAQGKFGNPYGRSLLRRAYKYYVMKDAFLQMLAIALDRKGTPLTVVFANPNATVLDEQSNPTKGNMAGKVAGVRADVAAQRAFKNVHNDSTIILPGKKEEIYDLDFVPQDSNAEAFISALNFCNKSITRALLIPALVFSGGDEGGSWALGDVHAKTFDKILDGMLYGPKHALLQQLIKPMLAYNFPKSAWVKDGIGDFSKREFGQDEQEKIMEIYEKGIDKGVIDANDLNDLNKMRDTIGFEPRETPIQVQNPLGNPFGGDNNGFPDGRDDGNGFEGEGKDSDTGAVGEDSESGNGGTEGKATFPPEKGNERRTPGPVKAGKRRPWWRRGS